MPIYLPYNRLAARLLNVPRAVGYGQDVSVNLSLQARKGLADIATIILYQKIAGTWTAITGNLASGSGESETVIYHYAATSVKESIDLKLIVTDARGNEASSQAQIFTTVELQGIGSWVIGDDFVIVSGDGIGYWAIGDDFIVIESVDEFYGIEWDITVSDSELTQIGKSSLIASQPIQAAIRGCVMNDDRTVNYYLKTTDFTKKADESASDLSGADGQVGIIIPAHYRKYEEEGNKRRIKISEYALDGYSLIPSYFIGSYEGYIDGTGKLCSVSGVMATTTKYRSEFRAAAALRGSGWSQLSYKAYEALTWLALVELADFNSQTAISEGATNASSGDWSAYNGYNPVIATGLINSVGIFTGSVPFTVADFVSLGTLPLESNAACYRGVEHVFGHLYKFLDGINIHNSTANGSRVYLCENPANFADDTETNYTLFDTIAESDGYVKKLQEGSILPEEVGGGSSTYMTDYHYSYYDNDPDSGWRVAHWGGFLYRGAAAGLLSAYFTFSSSSRYAYIGSRLCCKLT